MTEVQLKVTTTVVDRESTLMVEFFPTEDKYCVSMTRDTGEEETEKDAWDTPAVWFSPRDFVTFTNLVKRV